MMDTNRKYKLLLTAIRDRYDALRKAEVELSNRQAILKTLNDESVATRNRRERTVAGVEIYEVIIRDVKRDIYDLECWKQAIILGREVD